MTIGSSSLVLRQGSSRPRTFVSVLALRQTEVLLYLSHSPSDPERSATPALAMTVVSLFVQSSHCANVTVATYGHLKGTGADLVVVFCTFVVEWWKR